MEQNNETNIINNPDVQERQITEKELLIYETERFQCFSDYKNKMAAPEPAISKPAVFLMICIMIFILFFSVYCIISRSFELKNGFYSPSTGTTVVLGLNSRPDSTEDRDENGRYTSEGIFKAVSPSVVEIINFSDESFSKPVSNGSGIILSEDGYIVTNAHVIKNDNFIKVIFFDKSSSPAQIIGYDSKTDIAVIKISVEGMSLTPAEFGNSDEVVQGEQVMAIGNPGGLSGSISGGYVSGINRMIRGDETGHEMNCIQTDAAISPGNSGGALVNMNGQVIGITSSKYVSSSYEGLGFAITTNDAKPIIEELIANGHITGRFKVGISFYTITKEQSEETGLPQGLLIDTIDENCDIASSGLEPGDIIVETEGETVTDYQSFMNAIKSHGKGANDTVHAKAVRHDKDGKNPVTFEIKFKLIPDTSGDY